MWNLKALSQWMRYLSVPGADPRRKRHLAAARALQTFVEIGKCRLLANMQLHALKPVSVSDDGVTRIVTVVDAVRYGYNRRDLTFFAALREPDGGWRSVPADDRNSVIFDTYLPMRAWRRRIRYTLRADLQDMLVGLVVSRCEALSEAHLHGLGELCADIVEQSWMGLRMRRRLTQGFRTKHIRRQVQKAMAVDPELIGLARAARFRTRQHSIHQKWLTFVWQYQVELARIRRQTPGLLRAVAQHMYECDRRGAGEDPTQACIRALTRDGVSKRSYMLLADCSDRPFRAVLRRCRADQALDAVALALSLTESGHDAAFPRPLFYRVTMDEFGATMTMAQIRERLSVVPRRVFTEARARMGRAFGAEDLLDVTIAYRTIVDWFVTGNPDGHQEAGWSRWLALAHQAEERRRAELEPATWPCAVEELRTPDAEVLALTTPLALFEEGRALRHCAYNYLEKCEADQARLFSARMWHQGRVERATIGLWREPRGWRIWDIRGACNRRMGGHWIPLARQVAEAYSRNGAAVQLPLPVQFTLEDGLRGRAE